MKLKTIVNASFFGLAIICLFIVGLANASSTKVTTYHTITEKNVRIGQMRKVVQGQKFCYYPSITIPAKPINSDTGSLMWVWDVRSPDYSYVSGKCYSGQRGDFTIFEGSRRYLSIDNKE